MTIACEQAAPGPSRPRRVPNASKSHCLVPGTRLYQIFLDNSSSTDVYQGCAFFLYGRLSWGIWQTVAHFYNSTETILQREKIRIKYHQTSTRRTSTRRTSNQESKGATVFALNGLARYHACTHAGACAALVVLHAGAHGAFARGGLLVITSDRPRGCVVCTVRCVMISQLRAGAAPRACVSGR